MKMCFGDVCVVLVTAMHTHVQLGVIKKWLISYLGRMIPHDSMILYLMEISYREKEKFAVQLLFKHMHKLTEYNVHKYTT